MIYGGVISTPANTLEAAPLKTSLSVTEGIAYHLLVIFPPGPSGLLHVQIFDATYQMFPTTIGQSFVGDNYAFDLDVMYSKDAQPFVFQIVTWNLDDTYAHQCSVFLLMESAEEYKARYLPSAQVNPLVQALAEQETAKQTLRRERLNAFMGTLPEAEVESGSD